ncbi:MAG: tRNA pseudouridine(55) synthase TruB, partial [Spirochaetaceae bacterium]|nr:tRNA pseudouridine(55) synthase TruB [Spirochaetaceae bacterium]
MILPPPVSCLFLLDKPAGISSFAALGALKRSLGTGKVGHAGTLDPFATGLLLALSGKLTKAAYLLSDMDKEYEAVFRFGKETDTLDTEGEIIAESPVPEYSGILKAAESFSGTLKQTPPAFSAVKINGKRAYSQARKGLEVELPVRDVHINRFETISWESPDLKVRIQCSKGT